MIGAHLSDRWSPNIAGMAMRGRWVYRTDTSEADLGALDLAQVATSTPVKESEEIQEITQYKNGVVFY